MNIVLAPMEGLADDLMRAVITRVTDVDWCVCEFIRITDTLLPARTFLRISPELNNEARTESGVPVHVQLLGSDAACMADNAARAAELGAPVIDLNFGCPAPTVNRHRGGAILLREPELLLHIVATVRRALPPEVPLTAKMRLGFEDKSRAIECAAALQDGGAARIVVHARTRDEGYRPPAHWAWIARVQEAVRIPVIANGEIWSVDDYRRCRAESGITDVMLGRGLIARPGLAAEIRADVDGSTADAGAAWPDIHGLLLEYFSRVRARVEGRHAPGRIKMWLNYLQGSYPEARELFLRVRQEKEADVIFGLLQAAGTRAP